MCFPNGNLDSLVSILTRPAGGVQLAGVYAGTAGESFSSLHPAYGPSAVRQEYYHVGPLDPFQSSPGPRAGCNVDGVARMGRYRILLGYTGLNRPCGDGVCARPSQGRFCMSVLTQSQCLWRAHGNRAVACFRVRPQGAPLSAVASLGPLVKPDAVVSPDLVALCTAQSEARPSNGRSGGSNASSLSIKKK